MTSHGFRTFSLRFFLVFFIAVAFILLYMKMRPAGKPAPATKELDVSVCDPATGGPFTLAIDNPYYPLEVGSVHVVEDPKEKVQITVLDETEEVAGVTTRVVEEREWIYGEIAEISRNFYVQTKDGTVCYYGEDVDDYTDGVVVSHSGTWRAGENNAVPGIIMPANPQVGQRYKQETVPEIADDQAEHVAFEPSFITPAGTFKDVLLVKEHMTYETPDSFKRYHRGIGLIFDDGMVLTKY